jgi:uncharacterized protein YjiS (DUF1127 family)
MSFLNLFISLGKAIAAWHRRERAYEELMALDDRSLADIGILRLEICALAEGRSAAEIFRMRNYARTMRVMGADANRVPATRGAVKANAHAPMIAQTAGDIGWAPQGHLDFEITLGICRFRFGQARRSSFFGNRVADWHQRCVGRAR